ncbi:hypothetical protein GIB67_012868 [Kingdonia uniflora]|uniref:Uncharacterized protein n=1 Tax=Kingdonia uniflora TaxID=39325 RepID=A0A7J7NFH1_9MAGN|nr:hypothetical protein GIB67_012868 [Kingdonia uniflora]
MASPVKDEPRKEAGNEEEEDDELFEINLEAVSSIPPPMYWEGCVTSTGSALFSNCLLPVSHVSSAVPITSANSCRRNRINDRVCSYRYLGYSSFSQYLMCVDPNGNNHVSEQHPVLSLKFLNPI